MTLQEWYRAQGMTDAQYSALDPASQSAMNDSYKANPTLTGLSGTTGVDNGGFLGLSGNQWGTLTNVGGLAMKAMALPSQLDYYKTQTGLAEQQLKSNQQAMADRKTFNSNWANASNSLAGKL